MATLLLVLKLHHNIQSGDKHKVTQYQIGRWTVEGLNSKPSAILEVVAKLSVVQRRTGNRPMLIHGR